MEVGKKPTQRADSTQITVGQSTDDYQLFWGQAKALDAIKKGPKVLYPLFHCQIKVE